MSDKNSHERSRHRTHSTHSRSKGVLRTITFVLTPFLVLAIVCGTIVLAFAKPYSEIEPYLKVVFNTDIRVKEVEGGGLGTLNKYHSDDMPVNAKDVTDDDTGETHTMVYPYYGDFYGTLNCENAGMNDLPVYAGQADDILNKGVGWFNGSVYIGHKGNVVLAAHNHTYFYNLPKCKEGDIVTLETSYCKLTYIVKERVVFHETDYTYVRPTKDDRLTMYTCWNNGMLGMSEYRIAIICELAEREWFEPEVEEE